MIIYICFVGIDEIIKMEKSNTNVNKGKKQRASVCNLVS